MLEQIYATYVGRLKQLNLMYITNGSYRKWAMSESI